MATQRKTGSTRKAAKTARKPVAKPASKGGASAVRASKASKPSKPTRPAKPAPAKIVPVRPAAKAAVKPSVKAKTANPVVATKAPTAKAESASKGKTAGKRPTISVVERKPPAPVRPIGALPPEAVARATHRPTSAAAPIERRAKAPSRDPSRESGVEGVSEKDFKEFERRLLEERQKILKEMGHLENTVLKVNQRDSAGDLSGYSFHMADVGTDAMEREKAFLFASTEGRLLMEINEALRRVYRGEYGTCESCEKPIARARLEAMPYARLCVSCKEIEEKSARGTQ